jgi:predicted CopG family antitoxin
MVRKALTVTSSVYNKLSKMGFAGQSLGELIEDLCDFAKSHDEEFFEFLYERYPEDEEEGIEEEDEDEE